LITSVHYPTRMTRMETAFGAVARGAGILEEKGYETATTSIPDLENDNDQDNVMSDIASEYEAGLSRDKALPPTRRKVVVAASLGTIFEWYDFFVYGSLAAVFSVLFFPPGNETGAFLASLATFGVGFAVRPLGALIFGHVGDRLGRKSTLLATIIMMGVATTLMGLVPTYATIGIAASIILIILRLVQGLAISGEYGGASAYVSEFFGNRNRGLATSWIQSGPSLGFLVSLIAIILCTTFIPNEPFRAWGWRIPFILSIGLLAVSAYIRTKLSESPVFHHAKQSRDLSERPIADSLLRWQNLKLVIVATLVAAAQSVAWNVAHFYVLFFLIQQVKVELGTAYILVGLSVLLSIPLYPVFGALSDRIGRRPVMITGLLLSIFALFPIYQGLMRALNPAQATAMVSKPVTLTASGCNVRLFSAPISDCDKAKDFLYKAGIDYAHNPADQGQMTLAIGDKTVSGFDLVALKSALINAGYPEKANPAESSYVKAFGLLLLLATAAAMACAPIATFLAELFPARLRYTSISLPYSTGSGAIGGFFPFVGTAIVVLTGNIFGSLWYPVVIAGIGVAALFLFVGETNNKDIHA
jgi:MFS family permease